MARMRDGIVFLTLLSLSSLIIVANGNKYSKQMNAKEPKMKEELLKKKMPQMYDERPFRIQKVQLVWEKARKRLPESEWPELFTELKIQDKLELELKKKRVEGKDSTGDLEASTRDKMLQLMKKYQLYDDNNIDENETVKPDEDFAGKKKFLKKNKYDVDFEQKLDRLWKKAEIAGFSEDELTELRKEFVHHQQKIDEFNQLKNEIHGAEEIVPDNTIAGFKKSEAEQFDRKNTKKSFKKQHEELLDKFRFLEDVVADKTGLEFEEPRVVELWLLAKKANFSDVELTSFKAELQHFEKKLSKLEYYQGQQKLVEQNERGKFGKENSVVPDNKKVDHITKKLEEHERKVKKIHYELKSRVANALGVSHSEL